MMTIILLVVIGTIFGAIPSSKGEDRLHHWMLDLAIALFCGIVYASLATDWFSLFYLENSSVIYADFIEYCNGVSAPRPLDAGVSNKRSALPMLLPRYFYAQNGIFDALSWGAIIAQMGMGGCFYIWGRLAHSRTLGISILLLAFIPAPMNFAGRILSSYPAMSLCFMIGSTLSFWGISSKRSSSMLAAGIGIGLILLTDTRGLVWALPLFCISSFTAIFRGSWRDKLWRMLCLFLPLYLSYQLAAQVYVFDAIGIEPQVDMRPSLYHWVGLYPPPWDYPSSFTWGMKPLTDLPKTLRFLFAQSQLQVPQELVSFEIERGRYIAAYYLIFSVMGLGFALFHHRKNLWLFLGIFASVSPFLLTFRGALGMLEEHPRFYIQTLPGIIICWGFFCLGLVHLGSKLYILRPTWLRTMSSPALLLAIILLVFGTIPSFVSPTADWRRSWQGRDEDFRNLLAKYENGGMHRDVNQTHCRKALEKNEKEGRAQKATLYQKPLLKHLLLQQK